MIIRILLAAVLFIGCSTTPDTTLPYPLTISEEGLGALHTDTAFDQVPTLLIGFEFQKLNKISTEHTEIIYQAKRGGKAIAHIVSDASGKKIVAIHILSPLIKNKYNLGLGDTMPSNSPLICTDELCFYPNEPSVHYKLESKTRTIREITFQKL